MRETVLVHLAAGIGNIVFATPLLIALRSLGASIDLWLSADYHETADLFRAWAAIRNLVDGPDSQYAARIPAVPPFYWNRFSHRYDGLPNVVRRPADALFWIDEQAYYLEFARVLGYQGPAPSPSLPVASSSAAAGARPVVLAPGCKTGEMAAKRWPYFADLAARFEDVIVVGTRDDLARFDGAAMTFPSHVRVLAGRLGLRATAELIATAGVVVANDSGLGHLAAALGVPTVLLFGPTPHHTLGRMPANATVMRAGLPCEPCWFRDTRLDACDGRVDCLRDMSVDQVEREVRAWHHAHAALATATAAATETA